VEKTVDLIHCQSVTVITACRRFTSLGSKFCTIHLLTPGRPLVFSGNENLTFAPYNTFYPKLEDHLNIVGLNVAPNVWSEPLVLGNDSQDDPSVCQIMQPQHFHTFSVPFEMKGNTKSIPGGLSLPYQKTVEVQAERIEAWQRLVRKSKLTTDQRLTLQTIVECRFQEWLQSADLKSELDGLAFEHTTNTND